MGEEEVADGHGEVGGDRITFVRALESVVAGHGGIGGILHRVGHGEEVEVALFVLVIGQERFDVGEDDARFVVLSGLEVALADFLQGGDGLVGAGLQFGEFAAVALGLAVDAFEFRRVARGEGGAAQGGDAVDFFLLEGDDGFLGEDAAEGVAGLLEEGGLAIVGGEGRFVEEDFAELELRGVDQGEVGFFLDDGAEESGRLGVKGESGLWVGAFRPEHFAALGGEDEGEEILAVEDPRAVGEALEVGLECGLGRGVVADLERGDGAAVEGGFHLGRLRIFFVEGGEFLDRFLVVGFARRVVRFERGGQSGKSLRFEKGGKLTQFRSGRRTGEKFSEDIEALLVFPGEIIGKGELNLGVGDNGRGGVVAEEGLVSLGGGGVVAVGVDGVGCFEGLLRGVLRNGRGHEEKESRDEDTGGKFHP